MGKWDENWLRSGYLKRIFEPGQLPEPPTDVVINPVVDLPGAKVAEGMEVAEKHGINGE